jgi:chromosome segregation ATPase
MNKEQWRDSRDGVMAENEALALKVQELEESRDEWKRQWQLTEARNKAAEDRIKELTEALEKYGSHSPADGSPICEHSKHSDYPCTAALSVNTANTLTDYPCTAALSVNTANTLTIHVKRP